MWLVPILIVLAVFGLTWTESARLSDVLTVRAEITFAGTCAVMLVLGLLWRAWRNRPGDPVENARTAWLHEAAPAAPAPAGASEGTESWNVLRAGYKPEPETEPEA